MTTPLAGNPPGKSTEQLELIAKAGAALLGLTYGLGLLITNLHLSRFGLTDFSAFRAIYILTGFSFLVFLLSPVAVLASVYVGIRNRNWLFLCYGVPVTFLVASMALYTVFIGV